MFHSLMSIPFPVSKHMVRLLLHIGPNSPSPKEVKGHWMVYLLSWCKPQMKKRRPEVSFLFSPLLAGQTGTVQLGYSMEPPETTASNPWRDQHVKQGRLARVLLPRPLEDQATGTGHWFPSFSCFHFHPEGYSLLGSTLLLPLPSPPLAPSMGELGGSKGSILGKHPLKTDHSVAQSRCGHIYWPPTGVPMGWPYQCLSDVAGSRSFPSSLVNSRESFSHSEKARGTSQSCLFEVPSAEVCSQRVHSFLWL